MNTFDWPEYDLIIGFGRTDAHNKTGKSLVEDEKEPEKEIIIKVQGNPPVDRKEYFRQHYIKKLSDKKKADYFAKKSVESSLDKPIFSNLPYK